MPNEHTPEPEEPSIKQPPQLPTDPEELTDSELLADVAGGQFVPLNNQYSFGQPGVVSGCAPE